MKRLILFLLVSIPLLAGVDALEYQVHIYVAGDLPDGTNVNQFQNQVISTINGNIDSSDYRFDIRTIATDDTTIYRAKVWVEGFLQEDKNMDTFKGQVNDYFEGKFDSATCLVGYFSKEEW